MRIRTVKPEFWKNLDLARTSEFARLLALALLNYADDEGYFLAHPRLIAGELFPFLDDSEKIPRAIQELSAIGYLQIQESSEKPIGRITNFSRHQRVDKKKPSNLKEQYHHPQPIQDESTNDPRSVPHGIGKGKGIGEGTGKEAEAEDAAADLIAQSQRLFDTYATVRRSHLADALREAKAAILRHGYTDVMTGTQAIVAVVQTWSPAEKLSFVKRPDEFFRGDHWADDPAQWLPRAARAEQIRTTAASDPALSLGGRKPSSTTIL